MSETHNSLLIRGKYAVRLSWATWNEVCDIPGLISRENPAQDVLFYHDKCGEEAGPYIMVRVPPEISAVPLSNAPNPQTAFHGDWLVLLDSGKVLVVPSVEGAVLRVGNQLGGESTLTTIEQEFVFREEDFPRYTQWSHRNGNIYFITGYRNVPEEGERCRPGYPVMIDYINVKTFKEYGRPAHDWHRSMTRIK